MLAEIAVVVPDPDHDYDLPLDMGIREAVMALQRAGVETFESCQGGEGHCYPEPTIRFHGEISEGFRALSVALAAELPVSALRRAWPIIEKEPTGPWWELTFYPPGPMGRETANREKVSFGC